MDILTIIGGAILKGSGAGALVGSAAFVIVVVGTMAASLIQTPMSTFIRAWSIVKWVFMPPASNPKAVIDIAFANLLFLPMGNKLKSVIHGRSQVRTMVIEGIIAIAQGENPRNIESKLQGYFHR